MLNIDDKEQEELFWILESNNSSDSLEEDFSSSSNSCYQSADKSSGSPNIKIGCRDSCCNVIKTVVEGENFWCPQIEYGVAKPKLNDGPLK